MACSGTSMALLVRRNGTNFEDEGVVLLTTHDVRPSTGNELVFEEYRPLEDPSLWTDDSSSRGDDDAWFSDMTSTRLFLPKVCGDGPTCHEVAVILVERMSGQSDDPVSSLPPFVWAVGIVSPSESRVASSFNLGPSFGIV